MEEEKFLRGLVETCTPLEGSYEAARIGGEITLAKFSLSFPLFSKEG
jgi:hypothetical protein